MVFEKVKKIIVEQMGVEEAEVTLESNLEDDLGMDDLDKVEILMAVEEEFDIEIPDDDGQAFVTVNDLVTYITANM